MTGYEPERRTDYETEYRKLCGFYTRDGMLALMAKHWPDVAVVPREPTEAMLKDIDDDDSGAPYCYDHYIAKEIYRTMIAAAEREQ